MAQIADTRATSVAGSDDAELDEVDRTPVRSYWQRVRERFFRHRMAVMGAVTLTVLIVGAVLIPAITGDEWRAAEVSQVNDGAKIFNEEGEFVLAPFGYNEIGQNVFARLFKATGTSLMIGFAAVTIILGIGLTVGTIAGYFGGFVDNLLMRLVDVVLSLPTLFIILALVAFWGGGNIWVVIIAIGITGWTLAARLVRAEFLSLRESDYVQAARALGAGSSRIIVRHMLPPALAPIIVAATLGVADSVVVEAALSFLGFGINQPEASLGNMLTNAQAYFYRNPILAVYPGIVLILIVLSASFLGDGMRDALDPKQRVEH